MTETVPKFVNLQYRDFKNGGKAPDKKTLFHYIEDSMDEKTPDGIRRSQIKQRMFDLPSDKGTAILNDYQLYQNWSFGELALFNPGAQIPIIVEDDNSGTYDLRQLALKSKQHLVKGILYWLVCENHVIFIQPANISPNFFKDYVTWMICSNGPKLTAPLHIDALVSIKGENQSKVDEFGIKSRSSFLS